IGLRQTRTEHLGKRANVGVSRAHSPLSVPRQDVRSADLLRRILYEIGQTGRQTLPGDGNVNAGQLAATHGAYRRLDGGFRRAIAKDIPMGQPEVPVSGVVDGR